MFIHRLVQIHHYVNLLAIQFDCGIVAFCPCSWMAYGSGILEVHHLSSLLVVCSMNLH